MAEPGHELLRRCSCLCRERAGGVPEVVEAQALEPNRASGRNPDAVAEVASLDGLARRRYEDEVGGMSRPPVAGAMEHELVDEGVWQRHVAPARLALGTALDHLAARQPNALP